VKRYSARKIPCDPNLKLQSHSYWEIFSSRDYLLYIIILLSTYVYLVQQSTKIWICLVSIWHSVLVLQYKYCILCSASRLHYAVTFMWKENHSHRPGTVWNAVKVLMKPQTILCGEQCCRIERVPAWTTAYVRVGQTHPVVAGYHLRGGFIKIKLTTVSANNYFALPCTG